jgi:hypothetical protein
MKSRIGAVVHGAYFMDSGITLSRERRLSYEWLLYHKGQVYVGERGKKAPEGLPAQCCLRPEGK